MKISRQKEDMLSSIDLDNEKVDSTNCIITVSTAWNVKATSLCSITRAGLL